MDLMPHHCRLIDPLKEKGIESPFGLADQGVPIFECIRLLMGTVDVENKRTLQRTKLRRCYLSLRDRRLSRSTINSMVIKIFDADLELNDFKDYLLRGGKENYRFWDELKGELCLCLVAHREQKFLHAFLYLYRIIEQVSTALPLVYATSEPDYRKAFAMLSSLPSGNPRDGELAIFKRFVEHVTKTGNYSELLISYDLTFSDGQWEKNACRQFYNYVLDNGKFGSLKGDDIGFDVMFSQVPSVIVNSRNRIFHGLLSGSNFNLDELNGVEDVCATLVQPTLYWLSLIIIEIVKSHVRRYI